MSVDASLHNNRSFLHVKQERRFASPKTVRSLCEEFSWLHWSSLIVNLHGCTPSTRGLSRFLRPFWDILICSKKLYLDHCQRQCIFLKVSCLYLPVSPSSPPILHTFTLLSMEPVAITAWWGDTATAVTYLQAGGGGRGVWRVCEKKKLAEKDPFKSAPPKNIYL